MYVSTITRAGVCLDNQCTNSFVAHRHSSTISPALVRTQIWLSLLPRSMAMWSMVDLLGTAVCGLSAEDLTPEIATSSILIKRCSSHHPPRAGFLPRFAVDPAVLRVPEDMKSSGTYTK